MGQKLHILVVDDDRRMAKTTVDVLNIKGFTASAVSTGQGALQKINAQHFDCVLTDIRMPGMSGIELFRAIKNIQPDLPVVLMTAYAADSLVREGLEDGAIAVIAKPIDLNVLLGFFSSMRKVPTVCVVDDDPRICEILEHLLRARGYRVITRSNPLALEDEVGEDGQIVLLNINLGGYMSGLDVFEDIRARHPRAVVILMTGYYDGKTASKVQAALENDAFTCLYKPLQFDELERVIHEAYRQDLRKRLDPAVK